MHSESFLSYLEIEKRYSPHTVKNYEIDLRQFSEYLEAEYELSDAAEADFQMVRSWIVYLIESGISTRSINRKISTLKSFYKFLRRQDLLEVDPMQKIISPKQSKRLPVFIEESGMERLFEEDLFDSDIKGRRDRLIVTLLYETGIRLSELIELKITDVDQYTKNVKVLGKRNKERLVPLSDETIREIEQFQRDKAHSEWDGKEEFLLVTDKGQKMYPGFVYGKVNFYLSKVSSVSKRSPHVLRHTFATHMLNNGADLNVIKEILGHANLGATQVYTHNSIEKLKDVHKASHPRS